MDKCTRHRKLFVRMSPLDNSFQDCMRILHRQNSKNQADTDLEDMFCSQHKSFLGDRGLKLMILQDNSSLQDTLWEAKHEQGKSDQRGTRLLP